MTGSVEMYVEWRVRFCLSPMVVPEMIQYLY